MLRRRTQAANHNRKEYIHRIRHTYNIGDEILIILSADERRKQKKIGDQVTEGPYKIKIIYSNGTVRFCKELTKKLLVFEDSILTVPAQKLLPTDSYGQHLLVLNSCSF